MEIDTLNEKFNLELPESDDYVTIAGYILHFYQKFPKLNESIVIDKYTFKIIKVTATKIELVRMKDRQLMKKSGIKDVTNPFFRIFVPLNCKI